MYPTGASSPNFNRLPKIHKDIPLRPIVSNRGPVTYGVAKELARLLKPLDCRTINHVNNPKEFVDVIKNTQRRGVHHFLLCICFIHINSSYICN